MNDLGRLILLEINDLKSIGVVEVKMDNEGEVIRLVGNNGVGKSTVMEGIEMLFNGGALPDDLIRHGGKEATVIGTFSSGFSARRRIRKTKKGEQTASLEVFRPDGAKIASPLSVLKNVFAGYLTPAKLANSSGAELYKAIVPALPLDVSALEEAVSDAKDASSDSRAMVKTVQIVIKPSEARHESVIFDQTRWNELQRLHHNQLNDQSHKTSLEQQITRRTEELTELKEDLFNTKERMSGRGGFLDEYKKVQEDRDNSAHYEMINSKWDFYEQGTEKNKKILDDARRISDIEHDAVEELRVAYEKAVGPGGVRVDADRNVFVGDVPWENLAFSEKMKTAAILQIKSLPEGKLPIMFIEHGEAMNTDKRNSVAKAAIDAGATVFMEIVNESIDSLTIESETIVPPGWEEVKKVNEILAAPSGDLPPGAVPTDQKNHPANDTTRTLPPSYPTEEELDLF